MFTTHMTQTIYTIEEARGVNCKPLNRQAVARRIPTHQLGWVGGKRWRRNLEAELEESEGSARLSSNAGSNAGVAVGPLCFPMPRRRGPGSARFRAHVTHRVWLPAKWAQTQERLLELPRPYSLPNRRTGGRLGSIVPILPERPRGR